MTGGIRWSLILPSRNGEDTLPECLASLAAMAIPAGGLEIILVDNGSTDGTARIMKAFAAGTGAVVLAEPRPGKSHALNTALEIARGELLVFLDDDVVVTSNLLRSYASALHEAPEAVILAGGVRPVWRAQPPRWLQDLADEGFSCGCTPAGRAADWIDPSQVKGGNMCLNRAAAADARFGCGDVNFGSGAGRIGGEDSEFVRRVAGSGRIRYVPSASVGHIVLAHEMTWSACFSRYVRIGRGNAAQGLTGRSPVPLFARTVAYGLLAASAFATGARTAAARQGLRAAMQLGSLDYLLKGKRS